MDTQESCQKSYERMLTEKLYSREQLKLFANSLAQVESQHQLRPRRVLVNGMVDEDIFTAKYEIEGLQGVTVLLKELLENIPELDPDIIINGIPGRPFDVRVSVDLNRR